MTIVRGPALRRVVGIVHLAGIAAERRLRNLAVPVFRLLFVPATPREINIDASPLLGETSTIHQGNRRF